MNYPPPQPLRPAQGRLSPARGEGAVTQTRRAFLRDLAQLASAAGALGLLGGCASAPMAPASPRVYRVGVLSAGGAVSSSEFWSRLAELGYVEGQNLVKVELGPTGGDPALADDLVAELVRLPVDVIVARGNSSTRAAMKATTSIPIVMGSSPDPLALGVVESLARPAGNVTGVAEAPQELTTQKYMQLLVEAAPAVSRVLVVGGGAGSPRLLEAAATSLGVELVILPQSPSELEPSFRRAIAEGANGLLVRSGGASSLNIGLILSLAEEYRLPGIYPNRAYVTGGGLMTYATRTSDLARRAAEYVDRVLRGTRPADLPVEQPTRYDLVVNMRTARALGLTFSTTFLAQIDEVIE